MDNITNADGAGISDDGFPLAAGDEILFRGIPPCRPVQSVSSSDDVTASGAKTKHSALAVAGGNRSAIGTLRAQTSHYPAPYVLAAVAGN